MIQEKQLKAARPNSLIGLSLSKCVADIARGIVPENAVKKIVASTGFKNEKGWENVIDTYSSEASSWDFDVTLCVAIANRLKKANKIEQPILKNPKYRADISDGSWKTA